MATTNTVTITGTSPAAAGQAVVGKPVADLELYGLFTVHAQLVGATGGTLDVYLQRKINTNEWQDWVHFPQLGGGAAAVKYCVAAPVPQGASPVVVGQTADDGTTGAPALAANTVAPGHLGYEVRCLAVAGSGTSAGAAVKIEILAAVKV